MSEEEYDRCERFAKALNERSIRDARELRRQTKNLKVLVEAQREYEKAQLAFEERPDDPVANDDLQKAQQDLTLARETFRRNTRKRR